MEMVENMVKTTVVEMSKLLSSAQVVGQPINIEGKTLIPLLGIGFGFGAGGGSGKGETKQKGEGTAGGTGAGGGVKPVAVIIIDKDGVKVEPIRGGFSLALEKLAEGMPQMMEKCMGKRGEPKEE